MLKGRRVTKQKHGIFAVCELKSGCSYREPPKEVCGFGS